MRYACLVYFDPSTAFDGSAGSIAVLQEAEMNRQSLLADGISAEALTLPNEAVTVRVRGGKAAAEIWLRPTLPIPAGGAFVVLQAAEAPQDMAVTLVKVEVGVSPAAQV